MFLITANKVNLTVQEREIVTSGSSQIFECEFRFLSGWSGLNITPVFKAGDVVKSAVLTDNRCVIPWEVLVEPDENLYAGVYGMAGDKLIMPTVWVFLDRIKPGVILGDNTLPYAPSIAEQVLKDITEAKEAIDAAVCNLPYPSADTYTWWQWDSEKGEYIDTGLSCVGAVRSVNGVLPDESGNITLQNVGGNDVVEKLLDANGVIKPEALPDTVPSKDEVIIVPETASEGQAIIVTEVDEHGKPTGWETCDLPQSGVKSWNDLQDRPFGYPVTVPSDTFTWDGNTEGRVKVGDHYLVTDTVVYPADVESVRAWSCTMSDGTVENNRVASIVSNKVDFYGGVISVCVDGLKEGSKEYPKAGLYFYKNPSSGLFVSSLTINGYTGFTKTELETLDSKYLRIGYGMTVDETGALAVSLPNAEGGSF